VRLFQVQFAQGRILKQHSDFLNCILGLAMLSNLASAMRLGLLEIFRHLMMKLSAFAHQQRKIGGFLRRWRISK